MIDRNRENGPPLYQRVADEVSGLIQGGTLRYGERIPSVRKLSKQLSVSVSTVLEAYRRLEDRGLIEARPQSGYYVREMPEAPPEPRKTRGRPATDLDMSNLLLRVLDEANRPDVVSFGTAVPASEYLPTARLNRILAREVRNHPHTSQAYDSVPGLDDLRVQVAKRVLESGCALTPSDLITTSGNQEAIQLCLRAVTKPGDTVVIETPTYFGLLEALASLHLRALEVSTDPRTGICLDDLEKAFRKQKVAACVVVPTFGNPLGHCMPNGKKAQLVALAAKYEVPIIEDDVYGDLAFEGPPRPHTLKAYDREGGVLLCSSFSKTLAPGYRIGWTAPGRYRDRVEILKYSSSVATATPTQMAVAAYLKSGGFERHLRRLRRTYRELTHRMTCGIAEFFPAGTRVTRPEGGHVLWVELPPGVDTVAMHEQAIAQGVSFAPGPLFSAGQGYRNCLRLNTAIPWSPVVENALARLGRLAKEAAR